MSYDAEKRKSFTTFPREKPKFQDLSISVPQIYRANAVKCLSIIGGVKTPPSGGVNFPFSFSISFCKFTGTWHDFRSLRTKLCKAYGISITQFHNKFEEACEVPLNSTLEKENDF